MWSWLLPVSINPHLQSLLSNIFFHVMVFRSSPEIDEPSLGATKVNGHSLKALAFMQSRLDIWHVIILRYTTKVYCEKKNCKKYFASSCSSLFICSTELIVIVINDTLLFLFVKIHLGLSSTTQNYYKKNNTELKINTKSVLVNWKREQILYIY